jgi:hypothetical protein
MGFLLVRGGATATVKIRQVQLRIEAAKPRDRRRLLEFTTKPEYGTCDVVLERDENVFTCWVPQEKVSGLLTDLRYEFPKAYYQGWTTGAARSVSSSNQARKSRSL